MAPKHGFQRFTCKECNEVQWIEHSRIQPVTYSEQYFNEVFEVDKKSKEVRIRKGYCASCKQNKGLKDGEQECVPCKQAAERVLKILRGVPSQNEFIKEMFINRDKRQSKHKQCLVDKISELFNKSGLST